MSSGAREDPASRLLTVAIAAIAVLAAAYVVLSGAIARGQDDASHDQVDLAVAVGARTAGLTYGTEFRCEALLLQGRLAFHNEYQRRAEERGDGTPLSASLDRAAERAATATQDVVDALLRPLPASTGFDPDALRGFEEGRCALDREPFTGAERLLDRQEAAARRASRLGTAGGRVSTALALTTVGTVLLTLGEAARRHGRGRFPVVLGALVLLASLGWAASGALTAL